MSVLLQFSLWQAIPKISMEMFYLIHGIKHLLRLRIKDTAIITDDPQLIDIFHSSSSPVYNLSMIQ